MKKALLPFETSALTDQSTENAHPPDITLTNAKIYVPQERTLNIILNYRNVLMANEMHSSYKQSYLTFFCLLYMFRTNLVVHHQEHGIIYCITQYNRYNRAGETS